MAVYFGEMFARYTEHTHSLTTNSCSIFGGAFAASRANRKWKIATVHHFLFYTAARFRSALTNTPASMVHHQHRRNNSTEQHEMTAKVTSNL